MVGNKNLESFGCTVNNLCNNLPKGRSRCFDIGIWGGCGITCAAFIDGECDEPEEISKDEILAEYSEEEAKEICSKYECFK